MTERGSLIVLSGFSGVGKGTVLRLMMSRYDHYAYSVSATTRQPRAGEVDGKDYFFKSTKEFESMIERGELLEYARYVDHYYGTPRAYVRQQMESGRDVILEIEVQGALNIRRMVPEAVLIYMLPPDASTLADRLRGRGTETADVIRGRLKAAAGEARHIGDYDYVIVNDDAEQCAVRLNGLIEAQRLRTARNLPFIKAIQEGLEREAREN